ncbi:MAG: beta-L-arabinofuranosidase domain-containing protein [Candidatus Latescibacterota bacterium]
MACRLSAMEPHSIGVDGEIGRRFMLAVERNLLQLDVDDFLGPFIERGSAIGPQGFGQYTGIGKLIDASVHFGLYCRDHTTTGKILAFKNHLVGALLKTQMPDGYIGCMSVPNRMKVSYDLHEQGYIVMGLANNARYYHCSVSLEAATKAADFLIANWPKEWRTDPSLTLTTLGVPEGFSALSEATDDPTYRDFACNTGMGRSTGIPLRAWSIPPGKGSIRAQNHVYRWLERCLMQLDLYAREPNTQLLNQSRILEAYLLHEDALLITGSCSHGECWHTDQRGDGPCGETCATAYLIRTMANLMQVTGDLTYGDLIERALYNALFAAQSPDGRHLRYFTPLEGRRDYFQEDTYCCPNNFRRIVAEMPSLVYFGWKSGVAINLYGTSQVRFELDGHQSVWIQQETDYPNSGNVDIRLALSEAARFPLCFRIPGWCAQASICINGEQPETVTGEHAFVIEREWSDGDRVALSMPMACRWIEGRKTYSGRVALMRGPLVFCLSRERNRLSADLDLKHITIDMESLSGPFRDQTTRPDGQAFTVRAWSTEQNLSDCPDLEWVFTEFPDPTGEATYFAPCNPTAAVSDHLIHDRPSPGPVSV